MADKRIIVGITGASGVIYGIHLLQALKDIPSAIETILIISPSAERNVAIETSYSVEHVKGLASRVEDYNDVAAPVSSGSYKTMGMVVVPCSMRSLSDISSSNSNNLLARSADVTLKEGRKLVLVPRETPLHKGHLKLMLNASDIGATMLPPMPAFYHHPKSIDDLVNQTVGKILDQFSIEHSLYNRWGGRAD